MSLPPFPPPGLTTTDTVLIAAGLFAAVSLLLIALIYVPDDREDSHR